MLKAFPLTLSLSKGERRPEAAKDEGWPFVRFQRPANAPWRQPRGGETAISPGAAAAKINEIHKSKLTAYGVFH